MFLVPNILLVEDDKDLNSLLNSYLKKLGYKVTSTFNGLDALSELINSNFDFK